MMLAFDFVDLADNVQMRKKLFIFDKKRIVMLRCNKIHINVEFHNLS